MIKFKPETFDEFIGQESVKRNLRLAVSSSKIGDFTFPILDNILLVGLPGLGKSTLADIISNEFGHGINGITVRLMGPQFKSKEDFAFLHDWVYMGSIIFIDEIHALNPKLEEFLYPILEYKCENAPRKIASGVRPAITVIGATTKEGWLSRGLHARFPVIETLDTYPDSDLMTIISKTCKLNKIQITREAAIALAKRSRGTPKLAEQLLNRVFGYAIGGRIEEKVMNVALESLSFDENGLDKTDREILSTMDTAFEGKPVKLESLAAYRGEDIASLELLREPHLLEKRFITRNPEGRVITALGKQAIEDYKTPHHLGIKTEAEAVKCINTLFVKHEYEKALAMYKYFNLNLPDQYKQMFDRSCYSREAASWKESSNE